MSAVPKNMEIAQLLDFYGEFISNRQFKTLSMYYNDDLSLSEISELLGISRQAVMDSIKRGEKTLSSMEQKLALAESFNRRKELLREASSLADSLTDGAPHSLTLTLLPKINRIKDILLLIV